MADKVPTKVLYGADRRQGIFFNREGELISKGAVIAAPTGYRQVRLFDDFLGDVIADQWNVVEGADTTTSDAVVTNGLGGTLVLTTGDSATVTYAGNGIQITQGAFYNWKAANGGLFIETYLKFDAITLVAFFFGFTDLGTFEGPIESAGSGDTITTNASNAVGIMFDTRMSTDNFWGVGVKADTDATPANLGSAPVAATYVRLGVEVNKDGDAIFYINGVPVGKADDAVTASTALTPTIAATSLDSGTSKNITVDYIDVRMDRF